MRRALVTNLVGKGLQLDAELLRDFLFEHECEFIQYDQPWRGRTDFHLGIFLEVIEENLIQIAKRWYYFSNPEWLRSHYVRPIQRHCEKVFAKTKEAEKVLRERFSNVHYVGFLAKDRRDQTVERARKFLHIGGDSGLKGTAEVIAAWREYRYWDESEMPELTVISKSTSINFEATPGVTFHKHVTEDEIKRLQNSHLFHLAPSQYEGFGHSLHEAMSVGAVVLTTDAAPMNEFPAPYLVPSVRMKKSHFGTLHEVDPVSIREAVPRMAALPLEQLARMSCEARARFERGNKEFEKAFRPFVDDTVVAAAKPRLALLGNFDPPHSTENDLLWSLRDMGYPVITFQENRDTTDQIYRECANVSLLIYVHTHGWETPGTMSVGALLGKLRVEGKTKTAGFHLDRYWGLNVNDQREDRIGEHPFWWCDRVFTADGGNDERFRERNVRHYWLPPGVVRRDCIVGTEQPNLVTDVGFVGATGYHPEYSFRGELLGFLKEVYGERFRVFQGYRGQALNNLYASIRICIGDSCFGGADRYWSDRIPETLGRGGFLIHPSSSGLLLPGLVTFTPGNLFELQDRIDYYVEHWEERKALKVAAQDWVRENETYHNRMAELLRVMGIQ